MDMENDGLTTEQAQELRKAKSLSFHHVDGKGNIVCRRGKDEKIQVDIPVDSIIDRYGTDLTRGFASIYSCSYDHVWTTIKGLIRKGDHILLKWDPNSHQSEYCKKAVSNNGFGNYTGLNVDVLYFVISRGQKKMTFMIDVSVCPSNSARMISKPWMV